MGQQVQLALDVVAESVPDPEIKDTPDEEDKASIQERQKSPSPWLSQLWTVVETETKSFHLRQVDWINIMADQPLNAIVSKALLTLLADQYPEAGIVVKPFSSLRNRVDGTWVVYQGSDSKGATRYCVVYTPEDPALPGEIYAPEDPSLSDPKFRRELYLVYDSTKYHLDTNAPKTKSYSRDGLLYCIGIIARVLRGLPEFTGKPFRDDVLRTYLAHSLESKNEDPFKFFMQLAPSDSVKKSFEVSGLKPATKEVPAPLIFARWRQLINQRYPELLVVLDFAERETRRKRYADTPLVPIDKLAVWFFACCGLKRPGNAYVIVPSGLQWPVPAYTGPIAMDVLMRLGNGADPAKLIPALGNWDALYGDKRLEQIKDMVLDALHRGFILT